VRRLQRSPLSSSGRRFLQAKNARYLDLIAANDTVPQALLNAYKDPRVKADLKSETHSKCAYCESQVNHVYPGDVEHLKAKSKYPQRRLEYDNLTFACSQCNNLKRDYDDPTGPILDPYIDAPELHLVASGPLIFGRTDSAKGRVTAAILALNRPALFDRRRDRLESIYSLALVYARETVGALKRVAKNQLLMEMGDNAEYSFVVRDFLRVLEVIDPE
jgi:5-methylcytosine-specific restriction endonuclease McrA